jgi:hypothetical protein
MKLLSAFSGVRALCLAAPKVEPKVKSRRDSPRCAPGRIAE